MLDRPGTPKCVVRVQQECFSEVPVYKNFHLHQSFESILKEIEFKQTELWLQGGWYLL